MGHDAPQASFGKNPNCPRLILNLKVLVKLFHTCGGHVTHWIFSKKNLGCPQLKHKVFARLFQKAAGWRVGALPRPSQWAKHPSVPEAQEGRPNRPGDGLAVGNPSEGFPILFQPVHLQKGLAFPTTSDPDKRGPFPTWLSFTQQHKKRRSPSTWNQAMESAAFL